MINNFIWLAGYFILAYFCHRNTQVYILFRDITDSIFYESLKKRNSAYKDEKYAKLDMYNYSEILFRFWIPLSYWREKIMIELDIKEVRK